MGQSVSAASKNSLNVVITSADGKQRNLGRVDKKFTPRLWWYKFVIYPQLKRKYANKESNK